MAVERRTSLNTWVQPRHRLPAPSRRSRLARTDRQAVRAQCTLARDPFIDDVAGQRELLKVYEPADISAFPHIDECLVDLLEPITAGDQLIEL